MANRSLPKRKAIRSVADEIVPVSAAHPFFRALVYGKNGSEKTRFLATAPRCLIIDVNEEGTKSVRTFSGVDVYPVRSFDQMTYVYWYLREMNHPYLSFGIDTTTQMQMLAIKHVLGEAEDRDPNRDPATMSRREWGQVAELLKPLILDFRNLRMHCIFLAQERKYVDEDTESYEIVPEISPASRGTLTASVDLIGRSYKKQVRGVRKKREVKLWEPRLLVGPHDEYTTKDRVTEGQANVIRRPTVPKIMEMGGIVDDPDHRFTKKSKKAKKAGKE